MEKAFVIEAIKEIAGESGGKALGRMTFERQTGIRTSDWDPHLWLRGSDALAEAGLSANKFQAALSDDLVIQNYIDLARELKHLPVEGEIRRKARGDPLFPSHSVFGRFGGKEKLLAVVLRYCKQNSGNDDITVLIEDRSGTSKHAAGSRNATVLTGFVYLMKSGRHYKIGHTSSIGSRERQLAIIIPNPPRTIHSIETDDPVGVEAYWHKRFEAKRGEREWFNLSPEDVSAFKRWKRIT